MPRGYRREGWGKGWEKREKLRSYVRTFGQRPPAGQPLGPASRARLALRASHSWASGATTLSRVDRCEAQQGSRAEAGGRAPAQITLPPGFRVVYSVDVAANRWMTLTRGGPDATSGPGLDPGWTLPQFGRVWKSGSLAHGAGVAGGLRRARAPHWRRSSVPVRRRITCSSRSEEQHGASVLPCSCGSVVWGSRGQPCAARRQAGWAACSSFPRFRALAWSCCTWLCTAGRHRCTDVTRAVPLLWPNLNFTHIYSALLSGYCEHLSQPAGRMPRSTRWVHTDASRCIASVSCGCLTSCIMFV